MPPAAETGGRRVIVALIHHDDEARLREARLCMRAIAEGLEPLGQVTTLEQSWQPEPWRHSAGSLAARRFRQWRVERQWAGYRKRPRRWVLSTALLALRIARLADVRERQDLSRRASIELALTAKHAALWRRAAEERADLLVVLEDDARLRDDSGGRVVDVVQRVKGQGQLNRCYVDLAGGHSLTELGISEGNVEPMPSGCLHVIRPTTNTTCAYLVGRETISRLAGAIVADPGLLRLPADWAINAAFQLGWLPHRRQHPVFCIHTDPPVLVHGSMVGEVTSAIVPRPGRMGR